MVRIISIGGGDLGQLQTFEIDKYIVKSTNKDEGKQFLLSYLKDKSIDYEVSHPWRKS